MDATLRPVEERDWPAIAAIFNHHVAHGMAAYCDEPVAVGYFRGRHVEAPEYPFLVVVEGGEILGFGFLHPYRPMSTLRRTAVLTYFLHSEHTGHGLGGRLFDRLVACGREMGVKNFMANISSHNEGSLRFHLRRGFQVCGRFEEIGEKNGQLFDMLWVQRREDG